jgi:hypothetical protein
MLRECFLSSRSRVRVAVGAQNVKLDIDIRNYDRSIDVLLAGNHSICYITLRMNSGYALTSQNCNADTYRTGSPLPGSQHHPLKPMYRGASLTRPRPRHLHRGVRVAAALAADTTFSHVLGEGIAAGPRRPWGDHRGLHVFPGCRRSTLSAA